MQEEEGEEEGGGKSKQESLHVIIPTRRELLHSMGSHATLGFYVSRWGPSFSVSFYSLLRVQLCSAWIWSRSVSHHVLSADVFAHPVADESWLRSPVTSIIVMSIR